MSSYLDEIAIVIMVKNEEDNIVSTLRPYLVKGFTNFFVLDTGSTDSTVDKIVELFSSFQNAQLNVCHSSNIKNFEKGVRFDYAKYRNLTLDLADECLPKCLYCIFIDAEWYPRFQSNFEEQYKLIKNNYSNSFITMVVDNNNKMLAHTRLIRMHCSKTDFRNKGYSDERSYNTSLLIDDGMPRFVEERHEYIPAHFVSGKPVNRVLFNSLSFKYQPGHGGTQRTLARMKDDIEYFKEKKDSRSYFYLARSLESIGDIKQAIKFYTLRINTESNDNVETFDTNVRLAECYRKLGDLQLTELWLKKAHHIDPDRVEPLLALAGLNEDFPLIALMYLQTACSITSFDKQKANIDVEAYKSGRWEQLARISYKIPGCRLIAKNAIERAIENNPSKSRLTVNRMLINQALDIPISKKNFFVLILYSEDKPEYTQMRDILRSYHKYMGIPYLFYDYKEDLESEFKEEHDILYIRPPIGFNKERDSFLPGILNKTLRALSYVKEKYNYDYIVRTNISSIMNYNLMNAYLDRFPVDYVGPTNYTGFNFDLKSGLTEEKRRTYANVQWVAGTAIVMSEECVSLLVSKSEDVMSLEMIDDVGIGCFLWPYFSKNLKMGQMGHDITCHSGDSFKNSDNFVLYRNRNIHEDRDKDVMKMCAIVRMLTKNDVNIQYTLLHKGICRSVKSTNEPNYIYEMISNLQNHFREMHSINFEGVPDIYIYAIRGIPHHSDTKPWIPRINKDVIPDLMIVNKDNFKANIANKMVLIVEPKSLDISKYREYDGWLNIKLKNGSIVLKRQLTNIHPITFSIPREKIMSDIDSVESRGMLSPLIPGDMSTYIYNDEESYYKQYQNSNFALSPKKAGWDCMRHYEILANNCLPVISNIDRMSRNTMSTWSRPLLLAIERMHSKGNFKEDEYLELLKTMKKLMIENMTCDVVASKMLKTIGFKGKRILFLSGSVSPDYLRCLTLIGLKQLHGSKIHDYPRIDHIYSDYTGDISKLYGKGMTYTKIIDPVLRDSKNDTDIETDIINNYYDLIIYGSFMRGTPFLDLVFKHYQRSEIVMLHGEDNPLLFHPYPGVHVFTREM